MIKSRFLTSNASARMSNAALISSVAALLIILGVILATAGSASAQTPDTIDLVKNIGESPGHSEGISVGRQGYATPFTTGDHGGGYVVQNVRVRMANFSGSDNVRVSIYSDGGGWPGSSLYTLTNPATLPSSSTNVEFTATDDALLLANTTYWVVADRVDGSFTILRTDSDDQSGLGDWTIGNTSRRRSSGAWSNSTADAEHLTMSVRGYIKSPDTVAPVFASATVLSSGDVIDIRYNEDLDRTAANLPPASAFVLTINGTDSPVGSIGLPPASVSNGLLLIPRERIFAGETVTLSYNDPTASNDTAATQDLVGNDAASFPARTVVNDSNYKPAQTVLRATTMGPNSIWLEWDLPREVNRSEITSYNLEASDDAGNTWTETVDYTGDRTDLRYTMHRGLEPATVYSYRIAAVIDRISRRWSSVVDATTEPAATVYDGLAWEAGDSSGSNRAGADLCWTPEGLDIADLSGLQYGTMDFELDENSAMPWEEDGMFTFHTLNNRGRKSCDGGDGVGMSWIGLSGLDYFFKFRAREGGVWVESNQITVRVHNPATTLKSQLSAEGFYGKGSDGELVFPDVPRTVTGPFEVAVQFGYHLPTDVSTTPVSGLELTDFEVTNATLSAPADGFVFEQFIGYRLVVTPTTLGNDVTVKVKADPVTGTGTSKTNLASNVLTRKTATSGS